VVAEGPASLIDEIDEAGFEQYEAQAAASAGVDAK